MSFAQANADGLIVKYASYFADPYNKVNQTRSVNTLGATKQLIYDFDLTQIPAGSTAYTVDLTGAGTANGFNDGDPRLPAYASVTKVVMIMTVAATGGTSVTLGTYRESGTAISANSLITATEGAIANLGAIGARVYGAGALVSTTAGTASVGANDAYVALTTAGTFTAGTGRIVIEYIDVFPDVEANI